jgi:hypothetical protein
MFLDHRHDGRDHEPACYRPERVFYLVRLRKERPEQFAKVWYGKQLRMAEAFEVARTPAYRY